MPISLRMPWTLVALAGFSLVANLHAQEKDKLAKRYGLVVNATIYPQESPTQALASVVKAIQNGRIDYLLAQLADPEFVDRRVAEYRSDLVGPADARTILAFDRLVKETAEHFREDPLLVKELQKFIRAEKEAWEVDEDKATGKLKELPGRHVFLKKIQDRWFLENRRRAKTQAKK
jgi:hypothetical protein